MTGVDVQLNHVPGLFEQELMVARRAMRSGLKSIATLTLVQVGSIILWLRGSPWKSKWIAMGVAVVVGLISMVVIYVSATVSYLMRIEARDTRGIYECVAAAWLMMNGEKITRPMIRYLQRSRLGWDHSSIHSATGWWRNNTI